MVASTSGTGREGSEVPGGLPAAGVITLLFTDLVGSTELLERLGEETAEQLRRAHFGLLREVVSRAGGHEVKNLGDGLMIAFASAVRALECAVAIQRSVAEQNRRQPERALRVRIGVHAGEAVRDDDDFFGTAVVMSKRLCDRARGGQILTSEIVVGLVGPRSGLPLRPVGRLRLKGLAQPVPAVAIEWDTEGPHPAVGERGFRPPPQWTKRPTIVGRSLELTRLEDELVRVGRDGLACVLILGEAGVGKTRLAGELGARQGEDVMTLSARAYPLGATTSLGLWVEALDGPLRGLDPQDVRRLCGAHLDDLAALLPTVAALRGKVGEREAATMQLFHGIAELLEGLSETRPLVVLLDDMHLADDSSWEALNYLARKLATQPILIVLVARPGELAERRVGNQVVLALEQDHLLSRLRVGPLSREKTGALAQSALGGREVGEALLDWLMERSRGNPLFALSLVQALVDEQADLDSPQLRSVPERLSERVELSLRELDEAARSTLEILAVVGFRVVISDLQQLTGRSLEVLAPILELLARRQLVAEEERGHELIYEVAHPLIQEVVYRSIGGARRRQLHRQVGRVLLATDRPGSAAPHFVRSADIGDREAISALCDAVRQAEQRNSYREVFTILEGLIEILPAGDERWLDVAEAMSRQAEWVVDHRADVQSVIGVRAMREIDDVLDRFPDRSRRADTKLRLASFLAWGTGELDDAERVGRQALQLFNEAGDTSKALLARHELAWIAGLRGDLAAMEAEARQLCHDAETHQDRFACMMALGALGHAAAFGARFGVAEEAFSRGLAMARQDGKRYRAAITALTLAVTRSLEGRADDALALLEEARSMHPTRSASLLPEYETFLYWAVGDFRLALTRAQEAVAQNPAGMRKGGAIGIVFAALSALEIGDLAEARRYAENARTAYGDRSWLYWGDCCSYAEAMQSWRECRSRDVVVTMGQLASKLLSWQAWGFAAFVLLDLCEMAVELGELGIAEKAACDLEQAACHVDRDLYRGLSALGAARVAQTCGRTRSAVEAASRAVQLLSKTGCRGFLARALALQGESLWYSDRPRAGAVLREAAGVLAECGAEWRRQKVLELLSGSGHQIERSERATRLSPDEGTGC